MIARVTADHHAGGKMKVAPSRTEPYSAGTIGSGVGRAWGVSSIQMISEAFAPIMPDT